MKIVRFTAAQGGPAAYGVCHGDDVRVMVASPFDGMIVETSESHPLAAIRLLPPCRPGKIVAVGLNYRDHARELGMEPPEAPLLFLKPPSSVTGPGDEIRLPRMSGHVDHEAELAVVMGERTKNITREEAWGHILGYTCLNDVTARDLQKRDIQFTRSKSFDTFCPLGPWIETGFRPKKQKIECRVNGSVRQSSTLDQLIHPVDALVEFISSIMTLEPGDVIATGTPVGVGPLHPGDEVTVSIAGIGELKNSVVQE